MVDIDHLIGKVENWEKKESKGEGKKTSKRAREDQSKLYDFRGLVLGFRQTPIPYLVRPEFSFTE